jgi:hypothetical protein
LRLKTSLGKQFTRPYLEKNPHMHKKKKGWWSGSKRRLSPNPSTTKQKTELGLPAKGLETWVGTPGRSSEDNRKEPICLPRSPHRNLGVRGTWPTAGTEGAEFV